MTSAPAERLTPLRHRIAALDRARLSVVPRTRVRAPRLPFIALISALLLGGLVGLLLFNTSMQQASFTASSLEQQAESLAAREQGLQMELQELRDPQRIAAKAQAQGLVRPGSVAFLHVPDGTVTGTAEPAVKGAGVKLWPKVDKPAYAQAPSAVAARRQVFAQRRAARTQRQAVQEQRAGLAQRQAATRAQR